MKKLATLEVDIGISTIHAVIVALDDGTLLAEQEAEYTWDVLENNRGEIDPNKIWESSQDAVAGVLYKIDLSRVHLKTLAFSCFGDCFVAVDNDGNPVYPMLEFSDLRADGLEKEINHLIKGKPYNQITGGPLAPNYVVTKIYWMKKNIPAIYEKTKYFYNIQQFILKKLGLPPFTDYSMAARKMLFDVNEHQWSVELCNILEKDPTCFGEIAPPATIVGKISKFGRVTLPYELQVVLGAHDAQCGFMGLGVKENSEDGVIIANNAGTYNLFGTLSSRSLVFDSTLITPGCGPSLKSFHYQAGEMIGPTINWFVNKVAKSNLTELFQSAHFDGTCHVRMLKDPITGSGIFGGVSVLDDVSDLFTGFIESLTFHMKEWLQAMNKAFLGQEKFQCVRIGAGGAKSLPWIQLKADVMGIPFERVENLQTSSVGLAMISAVATGEYPDYDTASDNMVRVNCVIDPDQERNARYQEAYEAFLDHLSFL